MPNHNMRKIFNTRRTPRQLLKCIWEEGLNGKCGNWLFAEHHDIGIQALDAPGSIPTGSTVWRTSYIDEAGVEVGEPCEGLYSRDGWY